MEGGDYPMFLVRRSIKLAAETEAATVVSAGCDISMAVVGGGAMTVEEGTMTGCSVVAETSADASGVGAAASIAAASAGGGAKDGGDEDGNVKAFNPST